MSIINKTAVCSLVTFVITADFNTVTANENEHKKYQAETFSFALWGDMPYAKMSTIPLKLRR